MFNHEPPITSFGLRELGAVDGLTAVRLFDGLARNPRAGVEIRNADAAKAIWLRAVPVGEDAPALSAEDCDHTIPPDSTLMLAYGHDIDLYLLCAVADGSTAAYVAREVRR